MPKMGTIIQNRAQSYNKICIYAKKKQKKAKKFCYFKKKQYLCTLFSSKNENLAVFGGVQKQVLEAYHQLVISWSLAGQNLKT